MVKIFSKIRSSLGEKMLVKKANMLVRKKHAHNFNTAKTIGIIFEASNKRDFQLVKEFSKYLTGIHIDCSILGFVNAKEISNDLLFRDNTYFFCNKDLDFFFRPSQPDVNRFLMKNFDILIDLSLVRYFPLSYIISLSPAVFKVGRYTEGNTELDFMIDIHSQPDLEFLIEQIKYYVSILNNP